ncbi:hypothetical protein KFE25_007305 [Diacronema lutheri]|uniref:OTU domain-containing protein n=2 Tax=Diacronema lutheri TaxID=2081491 RepID=A0A8J6CBI6_DIALT|nr:hypothetical protein KFE25_007305 [Diacronema lutheri]
MLMSRPSAVRARLGNDPLVSVRYTEASGDCFYEAAVCALKELGYFYASVEVLREVVAEATNIETFQVYRLLWAQAAEGFQFMQGVGTLEALRARIRLLGRKVGGRNCVWADGFAMETIATHFRLCLLVVDERMPSSQRFLRIMPKKVEPTSPSAPAAHAAARANIVALEETAALAAKAASALAERTANGGGPVLLAGADATHVRGTAGARQRRAAGSPQLATGGGGGGGGGAGGDATTGGGGRGTAAQSAAASGSGVSSCAGWSAEYDSLVAVMLHASCREHMNLVLYDGRVCHALDSLPPSLLAFWGLAPSAPRPPAADTTTAAAATATTAAVTVATAKRARSDDGTGHGGSEPTSGPASDKVSDKASDVADETPTAGAAVETSAISRGAGGSTGADGTDGGVHDGVHDGVHAHHPVGVSAAAPMGGRGGRGARGVGGRSGSDRPVAAAAQQRAAARQATARAPRPSARPARSRRGVAEAAEAGGANGTDDCAQPDALPS